MKLVGVSALDKSNDGRVLDIEDSAKNQTVWQKEAAQYIKLHTIGNHNKFDLFCQDETLTRTRLDAQLNHIPISMRMFHSHLTPKVVKW